MKNYLLISFLLILVNLSYAQQFWTPTGTLAGGDYVPAIEYSPTGTIIAYSHNAGIYRSTNDGDSWTLTGITNQRVSTIKASPNGNFFAICNTTSGVYIQISTDDGITWNIVYSSSRPDNYFSGSGMVFSDSTTFVAVISFTLGPTLGDIGVEIVRSEDGGNTWQLLGVAEWGGASDLQKLPDGRIIVTNDLSGLLYTSDNGNTWHSISSFPPIFTNYITTDSQQNIFIGTSTAASSTSLLYRSTDNGASWQGLNLSGESSGGEIEALFSDHQDRIYASVVTFGPTTYKVYRSADNGDSWDDLNSGLPVSDVVYSITGNLQDVVFAGTGNNGVYKGSDITPVDIKSFTAMNDRNKVILNWQTASENNNKGFEIERMSCSSPYLNSNWEKIGFVPGSGTTTKPGLYSYTDNDLKSGTYKYRLKQIDYNGSNAYSNVVEVSVDKPAEFSLEQNYPNPFNPSTKIKYSIPVGTSFMKFVQLKVYDILGNEVASLVNEQQPAGNYEVTFDGKNLASGIYFYKLQAGEYNAVKKMLLLK